MRCRSRIFLAAVFAIAGAPSAHGQEITWERPPATASERAVARVDSVRLLALLRGDTLTAARIYASDFRSILPTGAVRSKSEFLRDLASGRQRYDSVRHAEQRIQAIGEVAIITGRSMQRGQEAHNASGMVAETRYVRLYLRRRGEWQLFLTQLTRIESSSP